MAKAFSAPFFALTIRMWITGIERDRRRKSWLYINTDSGRRWVSLEVGCSSCSRGKYSNGSKVSLPVLIPGPLQPIPKGLLDNRQFFSRRVVILVGRRCFFSSGRLRRVKADKLKAFSAACWEALEVCWEPSSSYVSSSRPRWVNVHKVSKVFSSSN